MSELIVFEPRPYWAPELQRLLSDQELMVRLCPRRQDVVERVQDGACRALVISLDGRDCLSLVGAVCRPSLFTLVLANPATAELECPLREAGVTSFLVDPPSGAELVRRIRRGLAACGDPLQQDPRQVVSAEHRV